MSIRSRTLRFAHMWYLKQAAWYIAGWRDEKIAIAERLEDGPTPTVQELADLTAKGLRLSAKTDFVNGNRIGMWLARMAEDEETRRYRHG